VNGQYLAFETTATNFSTSDTNFTYDIYLSNVLGDLDPVADEDSDDIDPATIPSTGFAPGRLTSLQVQPAAKRYSAQDMILKIPVLAIEQVILDVPFVDGGWDVAWLGDSIGFLQGTAFPTHAGNSVLTGHVYNADGLPGPFINLSTLKWGDRIVLHAWDQDYVYEVRSVDDWVKPSDTRLLTKHEELPWLTLITCKGYDEKSNSYHWRTVVRAVQVEVK
jgi:LPXTG-site transpeptidase (sortase) family protein